MLINFVSHEGGLSLGDNSKCLGLELTNPFKESSKPLREMFHCGVISSTLNREQIREMGSARACQSCVDKLIDLKPCHEIWSLVTFIIVRKQRENSRCCVE